MKTNGCHGKDLRKKENSKRRKIILNDVKKTSKDFVTVPWGI